MLAVAALLALAPARAQVITNVSTAAELATALTDSFLYSQEFGTLLTNRIILTGDISANAQMIVNANVIIDGAGFTIDMNNADRAFFIAGGNVAINNLTIQNGNATGGTGFNGGGAGAGLGGAIFVGSGTYYGGADPLTGIAPIAALGVSAPAVTLSGVAFSNNAAIGGTATTLGPGDSLKSFGGGGMGGDGGQGNGIAEYSMGMGGGGFGNGASGAGYETSTLVEAGAGAMVNVIVPTDATTSAGPGGNGDDSNGSPGGANGGGGGAGGSGATAAMGSGGGGGVGGGRGYFANGDNPSGGGNGGFGGGGGGATMYHGQGGNGGFGGGGGTSSVDWGGNGGFGGGGGGYQQSGNSPGAGGFGAARGTFYSFEDGTGGGGGGLGAGGAIFVMAGASVTIESGSFSGNSVQAGDGYFAGSAYGADLFLGGNVTFDVSANLTLNSLGGAGNLSDANVADNANDPDAQGGLIKTGAGNLTLTGTNYYSGVTTVNSGTLTLAAGALERGTTTVTVGQNNGDNATLVLGSSANLTLGGFNATTNGTDAPVMIAQSAGSTGTIAIGDGGGSSGADIGAQVFTGGAGDATVRFTQQYAAGSTSDEIYHFYTTLTGSLGITQAGAGMTVLQPLYGTNTFSGPVTVEAGTLATQGAVAALAGVTTMTVNSGGTLLLSQTAGVNDAAAFNLAGGTMQTGISLTETMGALTINGPSRIDFLGTSSVLTFSELTIVDTLAIWNYSADDTLSILSGTALGDLDQIIFYSDSGTTEIGTAMFVGNDIMPVPEPSTYALLALAAAGWGARLLRRGRK